MVKHKHHIIPKHMGGTDDDSNLIELTIEEHAEAHRKLYEEHGKTEDKLAWKGLAGLIGKEELMVEWNKLKGERSWEQGMTPARVDHYTSDKLKEHGKWLSDNHSAFKDSDTQRELGKRAAASSNHPNNRLGTCIHCGKTMNLGHIGRYHNDRCKERVEK